MYGETAKTADSQPELRLILERFQNQLKRYDEISNGVASVGHRFKDTNFPQAEKQATPKESSDGILYDLRKCVEELSMFNDRTEQALSKFNGIV